jgi:ankyrin repeat protein
MKKKNRLVICGFFLLSFIVFLIVFTTSSFAQEFSAEIKITQPEQTYHYDYFVKDHLYRLEGEDSSGEPMVIIANRQEDSYIGLHPIMKFYMEFSREEMFLFNPIIGWEMLTRDYQEEKVGIEIINSLECEKYVYTQEGMEGTIEAWYSPELKQRIKVIVPLINSEQSTFELLNIQIGSQNAEYFRVPKNYAKMASPMEQIQEETGTAKEPTGSGGQLEGEAPIGRILNAGGVLSVHVIPSLIKNLIIENLSDTDASIIVTPYRDGKAIDNQIVEKTISPEGKTKPSFSNSLNTDLIEIKANEGSIKVTVLQESFFAEEVERNEYYLFENFGQGLSFSDDKQVQLTIIGDNTTSGISQFEVTFFQGEYQDPIEQIELSLQKGGSKNWEFQPGAVKTADIVTGDSNGSVKIILEQLPVKKTELSEEEAEQLRQAIYQKNLSIVRRMLKAGIDPNLTLFATDSLLMLACTNGTESMVRSILDYHPDINYKDMYGNNALTRAMNNYDNYQKIVPLLLEAGINPNSSVGSAEQINSTALGKITARALQNQSEEDYQLIRLFLEKGVNVDLAPKTGTTPLMQSAYKGNLELTQLFLQYGADKGLKDAKGITALEMAKKKGHQEIVQLLEK